MRGRLQVSRRQPVLRHLLASVGAGLIGFALVLIALAVRDLRSGDRFDLVRWELDSFPNRWVAAVGAPFRGRDADDEVLRAYFALAPGDPGRAALENDAEHVVEARIATILAELGLNARVDLPGPVFPPVDIELAISPQVLVTSPRSEIRRDGTEVLRPDIEAARSLVIEAQTEADDPEISALVVPSGGIATYPAVVSDRSSYAGVLGTTAHEWVHHYLTFYPLGFNYYRDGDTRTINETIADIVGDEVTRLALDRWGDPTRPSDGAAPPPSSPPRGDDAPALDPSAVLRDLRLEVDALLAEGRIQDAERRMAEVRDDLEAAGFRIRRINQAYFAWYGTYAARPDATDPLGAYLREVRERTGSVDAFLATVRGWTSRADVEAGLVALGGTLQADE